MGALRQIGARRFGAALLVAVAAALAVAMLLPIAARAEEKTSGGVTVSPNKIPSGQLVEKPREYDGKTIDFAGEAIGEALERGSMSWMHINDDAYHVRNIEEGAKLGGYNSGMPVWLPTSEAHKVEFFGDYRHEGDVVRVRGVFHAACPEHGGDMDIHAKTLEVLTPGHPVTDPIRPGKVVAVLVLVPLALLLWWLDVRLTEGLPGQKRRHVLTKRLRRG